MRKAVLILLMLFGAIASSYNNGKKHIKREEIDISSLDDLKCTLDSLNKVIDEIK